MIDSSPSLDASSTRPSRLRDILHAILWLIPLLILAFCSIAGYWGRSSWELDSLNHFRLQYVIIAGVLCLGLLACKRRLLFSFCLLLLLQNSWEVITLPRPTHSEGPVYRALSVNIHTHNQDPTRTLELIREEQPDFIALIELTHLWKPVLEELRSDYPHQSLHLYGNDYGYCLLSRYPFAEHQPRFPEYGAMPRLIDTPSGPLIIFLIHPSSPTESSKWKWRNRLYQHIAAFCQQQNAPILMLGDFNNTPWSPFFRDLVRNGGLHQPAVRLLPRPTWPAGWPLIGIPIDHFLLSPSLHAVGQRLGPAVGSDHYPILLDFVISPE